jgi:UTP--glucose-1-phosphate uridylyltransferase
MIFITGRHKRSIEDHFDRAPELEAELAAKGKTELLDIVRTSRPRPRASSTSARLSRSGSAMRCCARNLSSATNRSQSSLADDLIDAGRTVIGQLCDARAALGRQRARGRGRAARRNGQVRHRQLQRDRRTDFAHSHIVEKPAPDDAPSTLAVLGRYVLEPKSSAS